MELSFFADRRESRKDCIFSGLQVLSRHCSFPPTNLCEDEFGYAVWRTRFLAEHLCVKVLFTIKSIGRRFRRFRYIKKRYRMEC